MLLSLLLILVLVRVFGAGDPTPFDHVEELSGLSLPEESRLVHSENEWGSWFGDGYSLWIFEVPESYAAQLLADCEARGLDRGTLADRNIRFPLLERFISPHAEACMRLEWMEDETLAVVVTGTTAGFQYGVR